MSTSQRATIESMEDLAGLTHDIFVGSVVNNVRRASPSSMLFQDLPPGEYRLEGSACVFATDLRFKTGGLATSGNIPDYVGLDAVQGKVTPTRRYARIAVDNLVQRRASGEGAFDDLTNRIFEKLWDAWESMEIRHSVGPSSGLLAVVDARVDADKFTIKDAFGNAGTNPCSHLDKGSIIAWYDVSASGFAGAARVADIDYSTSTITVDSAGTWEPGDQLANGDLIYFATTNRIDAPHFEAERNLAPNGLGTIADPAASLTTVFNISQTDEPRWKPFRKASKTFDHLELTEHWLQLAAKRGFGVTPETDVVLAHPSAVAQLARSLMAFQQQAYTGGTLQGGYRGITVSGIEVLEDHFFYHNVAMTLYKDALYRINLGGDADFWGEDGSMWSRIADYDGKDAFVVDYMNYLSNHRGAHGVLTGIVTPDVTPGDYDPIPDY